MISSHQQKMTFGRPALVVTAAHRALFGQVQALNLYRRKRILLLRFGHFHDSFGYASLWLAIAANTGATLIVTANALRLLRAQAPAQT
jgi:hypothetical protein